jgi:site-specific recombinase XerC
MHSKASGSSRSAEAIRIALRFLYIAPKSQSASYRISTHLLRAGVDLNTIRAWLGHVSLDTTQIYAEIDLEAKARALDKCQTSDSKRTTLDSSGGLMQFLRTI